MSDGRNNWPQIRIQIIEKNLYKKKVWKSSSQNGLSSIILDWRLGKKKLTLIKIVKKALMKSDEIRLKNENEKKGWWNRKKCGLENL